MHFYKYQGTGNDFVLIDNRNQLFQKDKQKLILQLCDRRFGIGADGLILLENHNILDFKMVYYNSDGNQSTMCGNGGRCMVAFAKKLGIITEKATFEAIDGLHFATIDDKNIVSLQMVDVVKIETNEKYCFLNTGSPHHVQLVDNLIDIDVKTFGANIRYSDLYAKEGSNINFVSQVNENTFAVRTYERGVEDETLSCGTGVTAVALAMFATKKTNKNEVNLQVEGGKLKVTFEYENQLYKNIFLIGPATFVFEGDWIL